MTTYASFAEAVQAKADSTTLAHYVVDTVSSFAEGADVVFDFLTSDAVGSFCRSLGIRRNWAELTLDEIAPADRHGLNVVPRGEADKILGLLAALIRDGYLKPSEGGKPVQNVLNDFMSEPKTFLDAPTLGHLDEFAYALAVELEHGRERGQNVTMNHPLLTGMVVLAHLTEDTLYYARLRVMEAEGELFNMQLKRTPYADLRDQLALLQYAKSLLGARMDEKLAQASA